MHHPLWLLFLNCQKKKIILRFEETINEKGGLVSVKKKMMKELKNVKS